MKCEFVPATAVFISALSLILQSTPIVEGKGGRGSGGRGSSGSGGGGRYTSSSSSKVLEVKRFRMVQEPTSAQKLLKR